MPLVTTLNPISATRILGGTAEWTDINNVVGAANNTLASLTEPAGTSTFSGAIHTLAFNLAQFNGGDRFVGYRLRYRNVSRTGGDPLGTRVLRTQFLQGGSTGVASLQDYQLMFASATPADVVASRIQTVMAPNNVDISAATAGDDTKPNVWAFGTPLIAASLSFAQGISIADLGALSFNVNSLALGTNPDPYTFNVDAVELGIMVIPADVGTTVNAVAATSWETAANFAGVTGNGVGVWTNPNNALVVGSSSASRTFTGTGSTKEYLSDFLVAGIGANLVPDLSSLVARELRLTIRASLGTPSLVPVHNNRDEFFFINRVVLTRVDGTTIALQTQGGEAADLHATVGRTSGYRIPRLGTGVIGTLRDYIVALSLAGVSAADLAALRSGGAQIGVQFGVYMPTQGTFENEIDLEVTDIQIQLNVDAILMTVSSIGSVSPLPRSSQRTSSSKRLGGTRVQPQPDDFINRMNRRTK